MTPTPPFNPRAPFTRAEAMAAGLTAWQLRGKDWARIFRNVYVSREVPRTVAVRARAAMRLAPAGTVVSHQTAALLWGGSVPDTSVIHVKIGYRKTFDVDGVRAHRSCRPHTGTRRHGVAVTTPEQTVMDLATDLDLVQLVVLGDRLVKRKVTTAAKLVDAADSWDGYHTALVRRAAGLVRPGVDSPPELLQRNPYCSAGFSSRGAREGCPSPQCNQGTLPKHYAVDRHAAATRCAGGCCAGGHLY